MSRPAFKKIQDFIKTKIDRAEFRPGDKIPTEKELAEIFDVSRMTVNRAIVELSKQGVVERTAGKGTFITGDDKSIPLNHPIDFATEVSHRGNKLKVDVIELCEILVFSNIALKLGVADKTKTGFCCLLNYENDIPILVERRWVNSSYVSEFIEQDFSSMSPTAYLYNNYIGISLENVTEAVIPDIQTQNLLKIDPQTPCLKISRRIWSERKLISYAEFIGNGLMYQVISNYDS